MEQYRITIRNPDLEMVQLLRETAKDNSMTLGECFNEAIETWHNSLDLEPDMNGLDADGILAADYIG